MGDGEERGLAISDRLNKFISNKFVCEIGCADGSVLYEMSKYAKKAIGIEVNSPSEAPSESWRDANARDYKCETSIVHADAYNFLKENTCINPDVFYFWANYRKKTSGMQWWVERILELRGTTNPVIISGLNIDQEDRMQLGAARELQTIYGGDIVSMPYNRKPDKKCQEFAVLVIQCNGQTVNIDRAAPNIDRNTYDSTINPEYLNYIRKLSSVDINSVSVDPNDL